MYFLQIRLYRDGETISDGRFISERYLLFPAHEVIDCECFC